MRKKVAFVETWLLFAIASLAVAGNLPTYRTVPDDPMHTRIYTLSNGLKVYLTVNKQKPRIQTYIAVHVGSKNDPSETTGLSHYLEHLMFKGTTHFGTSNYSAEKPLLDRIRQLYEEYRHTTDTLQRKAIYHQIDSVSYQASKYSIANEYDKMMTSIGSTGSNAFTTEDCTVYQENIPSNQIANWAKVQSDRFDNAVIRGFHTELEAVYEEYNIDLTQDIRKVFDSINKGLFPHHPYGQQTVIGTQEHLKNPSIVNIDHHFHTYYVPNNMAICMSGDLDPDQTIAIIDKYFSVLKPNLSLPKLHFSPEPPILHPVVEKVLGPQTAQLALAWRFPAERSMTSDTLKVVDMILANGQAGLIDEDITQKQKMVSCQAGIEAMGDYSDYLMLGTPKEGQTLNDVKALFLQEVDKLKKGEFSEDLLKGALNNFKLSRMYNLDNNENRAYMYVESFTKDIPWTQEVSELDRLSKIRKSDIVAFANRHFGDNYVVVYKEVGKDPNEKKIEKPVISPILMNRDKASSFLLSIQKSAVKPIEPVFLDYKKDLSQTTVKKSIPVLYKKNITNGIFTLIYLVDRGSNNDKYLPLAFNYVDYLRTAKMSNAEFHKKLYTLGCSYRMSASNNQSYVVISGLSENIKPAMSLVEDFLANAVVDKDAYDKLVENEVKERSDEKLDQRANFNKLTNYVLYNGQNQKNIVSNEEMKNINPQILVNTVHHFLSYKHRILYYGPYPENQFVQLINKLHRTPKTLKPLPQEIVYRCADMENNKVYISPYDAKNVYISMISSSKDNQFDLAVEPARNLYNEYFGGAMNSIVFQEMRESRALAYSAWAYYGYSNPVRNYVPYQMRANIITQTDKTKTAMAAFQQILNDMPVSQSNFDLAKQGLISKMRTDRTTGFDVLWSFILAQRLGLSYDMNRVIYNKIQGMTLNDVIDFQKKYVKNIKYHTAILGDEKDIDMKDLAKYGTIVRLSQKDIFGY